MMTQYSTSHARPSPKIALVIPAYREEDRIGKVVKSLRESGFAERIIVVDDGSPDSTARRAEESGAWVIRLPCNLGYGGAIQTGIRMAYEEGCEYVVTMDGDGQHPVEYVPRLLEKIGEGKLDLVIGSRFLSPDLHSYHPPAIRRWGMAIFRRILIVTCGLKISDPTSGFLALNRSAMRFAMSDWYPTDYPDTNALLMMTRAGLLISEVAVEMKDREGGESMHAGLKPVSYLYKVFLSIAVTLFRKIPRNWKEEL